MRSGDHCSAWRFLLHRTRVCPRYCCTGNGTGSMMVFKSQTLPLLHLSCLLPGSSMELVFLTHPYCNRMPGMGGRKQL